MTIDSTRIAQIVKGLTRPYPARDWVIVLGVSFVVLVAGLTLATRLFLGVQTGSLIGAPVETPRAPLPVSRDAIKTVLEAYQVRAANFAKKSFVPVDLSDPRPRTARR